MADGKKSNKVRIQAGNGNRMTLADASNANQKHIVSMMQSLDHDGDGCIVLDDLLRVVENEASLRRTAQIYRQMSLGLVLTMVVMFGVTLGSGIFVQNLMKELNVQGRTLVDGAGKPVLVASNDLMVLDGGLRSRDVKNGMNLQVVSQLPVIYNLEIKTDVDRRLQNHTNATTNGTTEETGETTETTNTYRLPRADFEKAIAIFVSGTVGLGVPVGSDHVSVEMDLLEVDDQKATQHLMGSASGGKVRWTCHCSDKEEMCEVVASVKAELSMSEQLHERRMTGWQERHGGGYEAHGGCAPWTKLTPGSGECIDGGDFVPNCVDGAMYGKARMPKHKHSNGCWYDSRKGYYAGHHFWTFWRDRCWDFDGLADRTHSCKY